MVGVVEDRLSPTSCRSSLFYSREIVLRRSSDRNEIAPLKSVKSLAMPSIALKFGS